MTGRRVLRQALVVGAAALAITAPASAAGGVRERSAKGPLGNERLSDERTLTRWASAVRRSAIRSEPAAGSRHVGRLRLFTEDRYPEVYLALSSRRAVGRTWIRVRIPARPNGQKGWVPEAALGPLHAVTTALSIDRRRARATLRRVGRVVWRARIGHGAPGTRTPAGRFYIREKLRNLDGSPIYGPWAFGTSAYSSLSDWPGGGVIGIHGTNAPGLLPGRVSHGCIRVPNWNVLKLKELMPVGTPIWIHG
jgi:L,D-transpeptidase catalytic domain